MQYMKMNLGRSAEVGVKDFYELFFIKWTQPRDPARIKDFYDKLKKAHFLEFDHL